MVVHGVNVEALLHRPAQRVYEVLSAGLVELAVRNLMHDSCSTFLQQVIAVAVAQNTGLIALGSIELQEFHPHPHWRLVDVVPLSVGRFYDLIVRVQDKP